MKVFFFLLVTFLTNRPASQVIAGGGLIVVEQGFVEVENGEQEQNIKILLSCFSCFVEVKILNTKGRVISKEKLDSSNTNRKNWTKRLKSGTYKIIATELQTDEVQELIIQVN